MQSQCLNTHPIITSPDLRYFKILTEYTYKGLLNDNRFEKGEKIVRNVLGKGEGNEINKKKKLEKIREKNKEKGQ